MVTEVQQVTASQVQIICRWQAISSYNNKWYVCVAVTALENMESDVSAQFSSYQNA